MATNSKHFYANLPENQALLSQLLLQEHLFEKVPANWHVVITDVKSSTSAVQGGRHEDVNFIATGSIVAVLNIAFAENISIPFFFGGDGATFIIPPEILEKVMAALLVYSKTTFQNFNLELRTGTVSVNEIYANNNEIRICKFTSTKSFSIPIILGDGLNYAEKTIKGADYLFEKLKGDEVLPDLSGMQCRWDKIEPPENSEEVVTLIVISKDCTQQAMVFSKVIAHIDEIYGAPEKRQPISVQKLIFRTSFHNMQREMRARIGRIKVFELLRTWLLNLYGKIYFKTESGKNYLMRLVEMSDTLVLDGRINTVITGKKAQRVKLQLLLDKLEKENQILYGIHVSNESVMSCYVRDLADDHIHFVDGAEGGYTKAAGLLKLKV